MSDVEAEMKPWYDGIEEKVVEAYRAKGLTPGKWTWHGDRCCALGALHRDVIDDVASFDDMDGLNGCPEGESKLFAFGFDAGLNNKSVEEIELLLTNCDYKKRDNPVWQAGFRSARAVINAGLF